MANNNTTTGAGGTTLLLIAFIVLKLCHVINWSWWWVLSPFWIPCGLVLIILAIAGFIKMSEDEPDKPTKSRWEKRMEEMQKKQKSDVN